MPIEIKTGDAAIDKTLADTKVQEAITTAVDKETAGLKAKRDELFTEMGEMKKVVTVINDLGGVEAFQKLASDVSTAEKAKKDAFIKQAEADGDVQKLKEAHTEQVNELTKTIDSLKQTAVQKDINLQLHGVIAQNKGISELLMPVLAGRVKGKYLDSGEVGLEVLGANGQPLLTSEGKDGTLEDLVKEMKSNEIYASAFQGVGSSGMNSSQSDDVGVGGGPNYFDKEGGDYNLTKAMELAKKNPEKAKAQASEAGFDLSRWQVA